MLTREDNDTLTQTGPGTPMGELFRRFWMPALASRELQERDGPPLQLELLGERLVAWRGTDGRVGVLEEWCPHRRTSLFYGRNEDNGLRCVYHGWKFDAEGRCVDMPNEPAEYDFKRKVKITAYPTREQGGMIWVYMGPPDKTPQLPELEWALVTDDCRHIAKWEHESNYLQPMEGDLDSSHVSFLHSTPGAKPGVDKGIRSGLSSAISADRRPYFKVQETDSGLTIAARRNADPEHYYWRISQWLLPFYALVPAPVGSYMGCNFRVPINDQRCYSYSIRWRADRAFNADEIAELGRASPELIPGTLRPCKNRDNRYMIDRAAQKTRSYTGIFGDGNQQDLMVTESMGPIVDRSLEYLGSSDAAIIAARKKLLRAARDLQRGVEPAAAQRGRDYRVTAIALDLQRDIDCLQGAAEHLVATAA